MRRTFSLLDQLEALIDLTDLELPLRYRKRQADDGVKQLSPGDWAHVNSLQVLPPTPLGVEDARFRAGNLLISLRHLDTIAILDPDLERVVWAFGPGLLDSQHHATLLPDGRILVFDNGPVRGHSIVRELDPRRPQADATLWAYAQPERFFSPKRGSVQRLANGNTLICESDSGRLFEVTHEGDIVWEYWSPFLAQSPRHLGRRIYRAQRYSEAFVAPLLAARPDRIAGHWRPGGQPIETLADLVDLYRQGWS